MLWQKDLKIFKKECFSREFSFFETKAVLPSNIFMIVITIAITINKFVITVDIFIWCFPSSIHRLFVQDKLILLLKSDKIRLVLIDSLFWSSVALSIYLFKMIYYINVSNFSLEIMPSFKNRLFFQLTTFSRYVISPGPKWLEIQSVIRSLNCSLP